MVLPSPPFDTGNGEDEEEADDIDLSQMTKAQLIDYAESNGITINKSAKKAAILNTIEEAKI